MWINRRMTTELTSQANSPLAFSTADRRRSKLCTRCSACLDHLWEDRTRQVEYHPHNTIEQVKVNASWGCEFCEATTATLRLQSSFYNNHGNAPLQIYLPPLKAHGSYLFIHLNWRPEGIWEKFPMQMQQVDSNATLNIAASCANDSESGCFMDRTPGFVSPVSLHLPRCSIQLIPEVDFLAASITNGPLVQRGWVLQEQLLARRVVYFGEQLFWTCAETWACQALPDGRRGHLDLLRDPSYLSVRGLIRGLTSGSTMKTPPPPNYKQTKLYETWYKFCQEQSSRLLTRRIDGTFAFSGVVKVFIFLLPNDEYVAGLWREDITTGLLWLHCALGNPEAAYFDRETYVEEYIAPS